MESHLPTRFGADPNRGSQGKSVRVSACAHMGRNVRQQSYPFSQDSHVKAPGMDGWKHLVLAELLAGYRHEYTALLIGQTPRSRDVAASPCVSGCDEFHLCAAQSPDF